jgi:ubiquitin-conjugating enzyme E2 D/E
MPQSPTCKEHYTDAKAREKIHFKTVQAKVDAVMLMSRSRSPSLNKRDTACLDDLKQHLHSMIDPAISLLAPTAGVAELLEPESEVEKYVPIFVETVIHGPRPRLPQNISRLQHEFKTVQRDFNDTCSVNLIDSDLYFWEVITVGPDGTPYSGGTFRFLLRFPTDYPNLPPRIRCSTPMFHCNIDSNGTVCLGMDLLAVQENDTAPSSITAMKVIMGLLSLLRMPEPLNALDPQAAKLFMTDRQSYDRKAKAMTQDFAM